MPAVPLSRRLLLGGAAALVLTGCEGDAGTGRDDRPAPGPDSPTGSATDPATDPAPDSGSPSEADDALVQRLLADTSSLAAAYEALGTRHRRVRPVTAPLLAHLDEHLVAFGGSPGEVRPVRADRELPRAVRDVLRAERAAARRRTADAGDAASGDLARTLASVAASHAQHAVVLEQLVAR